MGGNFVASLAAGTAGQAYGLIGELDVAAPAAVPTGWFTTGILGVLNDSVGIQTPINHPAAVTAAIFDNNTASDAGVISILMLNNARATAVGAGFRVIDRTVLPGIGFNYGLDLYYRCAPGVCGGAPEANSFNVADIRGQEGDRIHNDVAGIFRVSRGAGNMTGFGVEATAFADLTGWAAANGTMAYCSNCDPTVGVVLACNSVGAATGAMAFRVNGGWDCLSR
jgi:hypothetical protein